DGKLYEAKRGASIASCTSMPKVKMLRKVWSIAWVWTSPPGVPNGMKTSPSWIASAGLGVRRGRLPGATPDGCLGSGRDFEPRLEAIRPVPGITGTCDELSDGVAENTLPSLSTTQT